MTAPLTPEERTGMCWREMQEVMPLLLSKQDMREMNIIEKHIAAAVADAVRAERNRMLHILSGRLDFAQLAFERSGCDKWGNDCETYRELIHEIERHIKQ